MSDIMTIEEVAEYVRVSERTIYDWAQKGEIPGGKIGTSWRFRRDDIEQWVNNKLSAKPVSARKAAPVIENTLGELLSLDMLLIEESTVDKETALNQLVDLISHSSNIKKTEPFRKAIFEREKLMSTGIGSSIGVPHVRLNSVKDLTLAIGIFKQPITGYESLDNEGVQIVCMVAARSDQHAKYIKTLSAISSVLKSETVRNALLEVSSPEIALTLLAGA